LLKLYKILTDFNNSFTRIGLHSAVNLHYTVIVKDLITCLSRFAGVPCQLSVYR